MFKVLELFDCLRAAVLQNTTVDTLRAVQAKLRYLSVTNNPGEQYETCNMHFVFCLSFLF